MSSDDRADDAEASTNRTPMEPLLKLVNKLQEACALAGDVADTDATGKTSKLPSLWETLPQIVVVGGQSSGKSSVLESIVGRDFLPRGAGICTRRPLVLQLHGAASTEVASARFLHKPKKVFTDFAEVRQEIELETDRSLRSKGSKAVSAEPIMLSIRAPSAPSLTLVDMPGLTKVATADQPLSTVSEIEKMAKKFIASKNVVIVAVSAANADIATSDGVRVAREVDPTSARTLGVLTKLDLMDKGTDATEVLNGKAVPLKLGWCAVVNRSQSDIATGVNMETARANEMKWFEEHGDIYVTGGGSSEAYRASYEYIARDSTIAHHNVGTDTLVNMLVEILGEKVKIEIPKIQETVDRSARALEMELARLGPSVSSFEDRGALVHEVLRGCDAYERDFCEELDAASPGTESSAGGGEAIRKLFEETFPRNLLAVDLVSFYDPKRVRAVVDASDGYQPHLVAPEMGIRKLIELGLEKLHEPVERCVAQVDAVLQQAARRALRKHGGRERRSDARSAFGTLDAHTEKKIAVSRENADLGGAMSGSSLTRFPHLREAVTDAAARQLRSLRSDAGGMTRALVDMEASYFDAEFFRKLGRRAMADEVETARPRPGDATANANANAGDVFNGVTQPSPHLLDARIGSGPAESPEVDSPDARLRTIATSVRAYVEAVRARLAKTVPKAVVHRQVLRARRGILSDFAKSVGRVEDRELKRWMAEDPSASRRRRECRERLALLDKAREEIAAVIGEISRCL